MTEAAADMLRAYREVPTAQLALSGYLDIKGNVWGAIVRDGRGWVDMVTVAADAGDASCRLRAVRLSPANNEAQRRGREMHGVLREESAQATVEYAIVTVALLSHRAGDCGALACWHRWTLGGAGRAGGVSWRRFDVGYRRRCGC